MKILTAAQMREADEYTISHEPISSDLLMERAAHGCFVRIAEMFGNKPLYIVVCGSGNNGGDGLAIARMMKEKGMNARVVLVSLEKQSADFKMMLERAKEAEVEFSDKSIIRKEDNIIFIDAIFGTGLKRNPEGNVAEIIDAINATGNVVISIDMPSGLFADEPSGDKIIRATHTLTFQSPKLSLLFAENEKSTGEWEVIDIKLDKKFIDSNSSVNFLLDEDTLPQLKRRKKFSHKGLYGHSLLVCGSHGKAGAAVLAARACLRSGTGLLSVQIPKGSINILQTSVPEAMVISDEDENIITSNFELKAYDSIGIGPGIGTDEKTALMLENLLRNFKMPMVLDADALNIISQRKNLTDIIPVTSIMTPHPKEFSRLVGESENSFDQFEKQKSFSKKFRVIVILKGAYTCITFPDGRSFFNTTGNPGMAKGGSGDVLTGMITALLAQKYSPHDAALLGVYLHGSAGDIAAKKKGVYSMIASDLIEKIPNAFQLIMQN